MKVKICGLMDKTSAKKAVLHGADAIGFVFAESKRKISVEKAMEISLELPQNIFKVGVFVNETREEIERISNIVGLTHIQLHGDETAEFSKSLPLPVIKAWSVEEGKSQNEMLRFPCEFILLDGPKGKYRGGNGSSFIWSSMDLQDFTEKKIILAGGLTVENVTEGIDIIKPYMVDVSSGVETNGKKDINKIKTFIEKAKGVYGGIQDEHIYITK